MTDTETPQVTARVEETWAAMEIDGETQTIRADTEEEVRSELLRRTVQIAADAGTDVQLVTTDRDGEWRLVVSPDGDISETGESTNPQGAHHATGEIAVHESLTSDEADAAAPSVDTPDDEPSAASFYSGWPTETVTISPPPPGPATQFDDAPATAEVPLVAAEPTVAPQPAAASPIPARIPPLPEPVQAAASPSATLPSATPPSADSSAASVIDEPVAPTPEPDPAPAPEPDPAPAPATMPTLADFRASQPASAAGPADRGWRGALRRGTGGLISPKPGAAEVRERAAIASVTRALTGPRTICVINPKGGAHKTTATMLIAATFGLHRGGYTLAWDNNETRGTLGWRAHQAGHTNTAVDLLADLHRFADPRSARVGDLDNYVRTQADAQFDVLASDEDAAATSEIDGDGFNRLHEMLQRFYRIIVIDTGNNMRASNWEAAVAAADQLVIVSAMREDTAGSAAWMVEGLARKGHEDKLRSAVTVLSAPDKTVDDALRRRLFDHFGSLTRAVVEVPYDPALVSGAGITIGAIAPATREAWLLATARIADGL